MSDSGPVFERSGSGRRRGSGGSPVKRGLAVMLSFGILLLFAGLIWYAYNWAYADKEASQVLPLITAEAAPIKVKPDNEGGKLVRHQDSLVMNDAMVAAEEIPKVEHLLPPPEEPAVVEPVPEPEMLQEEVAQEAVTPDEPEAPVVDLEALKGDGAAAQDAPLPETWPPDSAADKPDPAEPEAETAAPSLETAEPAAPEAEEADPIGALIAQATQPEAAAEETAPEVPTESAAPAEPAAPAAVQSAQVPTDGGYIIQLLAATSEGGAKAEWQRVKQRHSRLLGDMALQIETTERDGSPPSTGCRPGPFPTGRPPAISAPS